MNPAKTKINTIINKIKLDLKKIIFTLESNEELTQDIEFRNKINDMIEVLNDYQYGNRKKGWRKEIHKYGFKKAKED
jgi:hypothetical protein